MEEGKIARRQAVGLYLLMKLILTKLFSLSLTQSGILVLLLWIYFLWKYVEWEGGVEGERFSLRIKKD